MPKELLTAPRSVIDAVVDKAILGRLRTLERERGCLLPLVVTQWTADPVGPSIRVTTDPDLDPEAEAGQARLMFRKNSGGGGSGNSGRWIPEILASSADS